MARQPSLALSPLGFGRTGDGETGRRETGQSGSNEESRRRETAESIRILGLRLEAQTDAYDSRRVHSPIEFQQVARGQPRVEPQSAPFERPAIPERPFPRPASRALLEARRGPTCLKSLSYCYN